MSTVPLEPVSDTARLPTYFHVSSKPLSDGIVLNVAVWKNQVEYKVAKSACDTGLAQLASLMYADWITVVKFNSPWKITATYVKEALFESVREQSYPDLEGRLDSTYLWFTLTEAERFINTWNKGDGYIYECSSTIDQGHRKFDMNLFDAVSGFDFSAPLIPQFESVRDSARSYYAQKSSNDPLWEILATSPITISRLIFVYKNGSNILPADTTNGETS